MEFHQHDRFASVNPIETQNKNSENNADGNGVTSNTESRIGHERTLFQFDLGKNQTPNKRGLNLNSIGVEELKGLPTIWEENVAGNEEEQVGPLVPSEVYDEALDPTMRQHNEDRVSEAICLLPGFGSKLISNALKLKTRMCNKWELNGWCPYGDKCHFAHGSAELRGYDGRLLKTEAENSAICSAKQTALPAKASIGSVDGAHYAGVSLRRLPNGAQKRKEERYLPEFGRVPTKLAMIFEWALQSQCVILGIILDKLLFSR